MSKSLYTTRSIFASYRVYKNLIYQKHAAESKKKLPPIFLNQTQRIISLKQLTRLLKNCTCYSLIFPALIHFYLCLFHLFHSSFIFTIRGYAPRGIWGSFCSLWRVVVPSSKLVLIKLPWTLRKYIVKEKRTKTYRHFYRRITKLFQLFL